MDGEATVRSILHCDLDAFYASVEQVERPELRGTPVIVGGDPGKRGVVAAASYEARKFGVHSAMPMSTAVRLCPQGNYVHARFDLYGQYSQRVFEIYRNYTPLVEPMSLDEAYLDLTGSERAVGPAREAGARIQNQVKEATQLDVSVGIGTSKVVAKIASDLQKPRGFVYVEPGTEEAFLAPLPIRRMPGLGPSMEEKLQVLRLTTIGDLAALPIEQFTQRFGKSGFQLWEFAHGIDRRSVQPPGNPKSISRETTFERDMDDLTEMESVLRQLMQHSTKSMREHNLHGRTVHLKLRYSDFTTYVRSHSLPRPTQIENDFVQAVVDLFRQNYDTKRKVRLLGAGISNFSQESQQLSLFDGPAPKQALITASVDKIRDKFGWKALTVGPGKNVEQRDWRRDDLPT